LQEVKEREMAKKQIKDKEIEEARNKVSQTTSELKQ